MSILVSVALAPFPSLSYGVRMKNKTNKISQPLNTDEPTYFGFETVSADDKAKMVKGVFDNVASQYDIMNDLMSLGIHRVWKSIFVDYLDPQPKTKLIDVGGGTGDIAFKFLKSGGEEVTVCDINYEMVNTGRDRAINKGILTGIDWINGDAENLPISKNAFDAYTTAFCIRNVTNIENVLSEAHRVLKPGGHFLCLEFSPVVLPILKKIYDTYSFNVLPWLGRVIVDDERSYRYLAESIRRFPDQGKFATLIAKAGFKHVNYKSLSGGIVTIHSAWRI